MENGVRRPFQPVNPQLALQLPVILYTTMCWNRGRTRPGRAVNKAHTRSSQATDWTANSRSLRGPSPL